MCKMYRNHTVICVDYRFGWFVCLFVCLFVCFVCFVCLFCCGFLFFWQMNLWFLCKKINLNVITEPSVVRNSTARLGVQVHLGCAFMTLTDTRVQVHLGCMFMTLTDTSVQVPLGCVFMMLTDTSVQVHLGCVFMTLTDTSVQVHLGSAFMTDTRVQCTWVVRSWCSLTREWRYTWVVCSWRTLTREHSQCGRLTSAVLGLCCQWFEAKCIICIVNIEIMTSFSFKLWGTFFTSAPLVLVPYWERKNWRRISSFLLFRHIYLF